MKESERNDELIARLYEQVTELKKENDLLKEKANIVGVRWYGDSTFFIKLSHSVAGITLVKFDTPDQMAVIDFPAWNKCKHLEQVQSGILVRDDSVIDEMGIMGNAAPKDREVPVNALTKEDIINIYEKTTPKQFEKRIDSLTHYFVCRHFLRVYNQMSEADKRKHEGKMLYVKRYGDYLFAVYRWSKLHKYDIDWACENAGMENYENRTLKDKIDFLVNLDIQSNQ